MTSRFVRVAAPAAIVLASVTAMMSAPASAASKSDDVWVRFESAKPRHAIVKLANAGKSPVSVKVVRNNGGRLVARQVKNTRSRAADFPAYAGGPSAPHAVVAVVNTNRDRLAPRSQAFAFGADFKIDAAGIAGRDDGNNLMQRGNFDSPAQYKLQVEQGVVSCRVKGGAGALLITGDTVVNPANWYRVSCSVTPNGDGLSTVVLRLSRLTTKGRITLVESHRAVVAIGRLDFPKARPLSIGGKVKDKLGLPQRVEQFNGLIDNAFLRLG